MSNLPVPQRGQPIDFQFIYDIVNSINTLYDNAATTSKHVNIYTDSGVQNIDLNHLAIDATYLKVTATSSAIDKPVSATYTFKTLFDKPPIVTITPKADTSSVSVSDDAVVVITQVTTSAVSFKVTFPTASTKNKGSVSVYINAIGIAK